MGHYRYLHLKDDVPVEPPVELDSSDDEEAIELVRLSMERTDCELWRGSRDVEDERGAIVHRLPFEEAVQLTRGACA